MQPTKDIIDIQKIIDDAQKIIKGAQKIIKNTRKIKRDKFKLSLLILQTKLMKNLIFNNIERILNNFEYFVKSV